MTFGAYFTFVTIICKGTPANTVSRLEFFDTLADITNNSNDLMTGHLRIWLGSPVTFSHMNI